MDPAYQLHITWKTLDKIGEKAEDKFPASYTRKRFGAYHDAIIDACEKKRTPIDTYKVGDVVVYYSTTKFWAMNIRGETYLTANKGIVEKVGPKSCYIDGAFRPLYKILGKLPRKG